MTFPSNNVKDSVGTMSRDNNGKFLFLDGSYAVSQAERAGSPATSSSSYGVGANGSPK
jgi:hypothetical protein